MKHSKHLVFIALTVCCLACLAACSDEKTLETPKGDVSVKQTRSGVQVKSKDGSMSMEGNEKGGRVRVRDADGRNTKMNYAADKLVEGFPADLPIYAGAKVKMSQFVENRHAVAMLKTGDKQEEAFKFYKEALPKNGWSVEKEVTTASMAMLMGTKGDNRVTVQILNQGGETNINMTMSGKDGPGRDRPGRDRRAKDRPGKDMAEKDSPGKDGQ